jgi:hypothetical protein
MRQRLPMSWVLAIASSNPRSVPARYVGRKAIDESETRRTEAAHRPQWQRGQSRGEALRLEQIRLFSRDQIPQRLKLEPPRLVSSNLLPRGLSARRLDLRGRAGGCGKQLSMAATVNCDEPPGGFVDRMPDGQETVILQDDRFVAAKRFRDALSLRGFIDDAGEVGE